MPDSDPQHHPFTVNLPRFWARSFWARILGLSGGPGAGSKAGPGAKAGLGVKPGGTEKAGAAWWARTPPRLTAMIIPFLAIGLIMLTYNRDSGQATLSVQPTGPTAPTVPTDAAGSPVGSAFDSGAASPSYSTITDGAFGASTPQTPQTPAQTSFPAPTSSLSPTTLTTPVATNGQPVTVTVTSTVRVTVTAGAAAAPLSGAALPTGANATRLLFASGIPARAKAAYVAAATRAAAATPGCHLDWSLLAGIGRIESNHARVTAAGTLTAAGRATPPVYGPHLDGTGGTTAVPDTDHGTLDADPSWDRAVGPMQFLPTTWRSYATDGDGDGVTDPQDIDDAAATAGRYLCLDGTDLSTAVGRWNAVYRYNHSSDYANLVVAMAVTYATGIPSPLLPAPAGVGTTSSAATTDSTTASTSTSTSTSGTTTVTVTCTRTATSSSSSSSSTSASTSTSSSASTC